MNTPSSIMNIPVLTEIIESPAAAETPPERPALAPSRDESAAPPFYVDSRGELDEMERRLTKRILQLVHERIDFILSHAIKDSVAFALQKATEELAAEIRNDLQSTLEVVVSLAVSQEIERLRQGSANMSDNA